MSYNPNNLTLNEDDVMLECNSGQTGFDLNGEFIVFDTLTNPGSLPVTNNSATNGQVIVPPGLYQGSWEVDFDAPAAGTSIIVMAKISVDNDIRQYIVPAADGFKGCAGQGVYRVQDTGHVSGLSVKVEGAETVNVSYAFLKLRPLTHA